LTDLNRQVYGRHRHIFGRVHKLTQLMPRTARVHSNEPMDDFERLFERWQVATLCLWAQMAQPCAESPWVRAFILAQLRAVADGLRDALCARVREAQRELPLL